MAQTQHLTDPATAPRLRVLYIAGAHRSGTTLVDRTLGQIDGVVSVGEMRHLWLNGFLEGHLCGCGESVPQCDFWTAVFARSLAAGELRDPVTLYGLQGAVDRIRYLPQLAGPWKSRRFKAAVREYGSVLSRIYAAIREESGARIIVDSSKDASYGLLLASVPGVEVDVLHLVRDSRAVAFSRMRVKPNPADPRGAGRLPQERPIRTAGFWVFQNLVARAMASKASRYRRMRYEDFVADPGAAVLRIGEPYGISPDDLRFIQGSRVSLEVQHTVSGNPIRMSTGHISIQEDDEWRRHMSRRHRLLVTGVTWPLLRYAGYSVR
jgi:hypothetical protein